MHITKRIKLNILFAAVVKFPLMHGVLIYSIFENFKS